MELSILAVIVGVYWYCCYFQSSICEEQSLLVSTWIQLFVSLPEEGKGTRPALWFVFGLGPIWLWPYSKLVSVSPSSTSHSLCSSLLVFSLWVPFICPPLPPDPLSFFSLHIALFSHFYWISVLLFLPLSFFFLFLLGCFTYSILVSPLGSAVAFTLYSKWR